MASLSPAATAITGGQYIRMGKLVIVTIETTPSLISHGLALLSGIPTANGRFYFNLGMDNGQSLPAVISGSSLNIYYPGENISPGRIDATICYMSI